MGSSNNALKRKWTHLNIPSQSNRSLQRAFLKYGVEQLQFEVLEQCSPDQLIVKEQRWVDKYKADGVVLYNYDGPIGRPPVAKKGKRGNPRKPRVERSCACGCGQKFIVIITSPKKAVVGHLLSQYRQVNPPWNKGKKRPEGWTPWNKGLTKEVEPRLAVIGQKTSERIRGVPRPDRRRTHCWKGHLRSPDNVDTGGRCRTCARAWRKQYSSLHAAGFKGRVRPERHLAVCKRGHPRTLENLTKVSRACKVCRRERYRLRTQGVNL